MADTMKAVRIHQFGGPEGLVYGDAPKPEPKDGEVLIKIAAAGVNPGEAKVREGNFAEYHTRPFTLRFDISGIINEVARGVVNVQVGDAVDTNCASTLNVPV